MIIIPFKIYLKSFPIQKLFHFFEFSLSLHECRKSLFNVAQLERHGPNQADDNPRNWRGTFGAVSTRILQEIYSQRTDVVFASSDKFLQKMRLALCCQIFLYQLKEGRFRSFFLKSRFIVNKPVNWQLWIKGKQKRYFVRSF